MYAGGTKGKDKDFTYNYDYRNWAEFARAVAEKDPVHFYTANGGEDFSEYEHPNIVMNAPVNYDALIFKLAGHSAGLVGSPIPLPDFEDSMPNKLFEYVSAGIPCIVINAPEAQKFVEEHNLGVGIRDPSDVHEALEQLTKHSVRADRWRYTMEGQIPALLALYREILCLKGPRIINQMGG